MLDQLLDIVVELYFLPVSERSFFRLERGDRTSLIEKDTHDNTTCDPILRFTQLVCRLDESKQCADSRFPDTLVVVFQQVNQDLHTLLDIRNESAFRSGKELSDRVGRNLLFDRNGTVDFAVHGLESVEVGILFEILSVIESDFG